MAKYLNPHVLEARSGPVSRCAAPPRFRARRRQPRRRGAAGRPARARALPRRDRRDRRADDGEGRPEAAAARADLGRRPTGAADATGTRPLRPPPLRLTAAAGRRQGLGRGRAPVQARVARLSFRGLRRRFRAADEARAAPVPALGRASRRRRRGTRHVRRARGTDRLSAAGAVLAVANACARRPLRPSRRAVPRRHRSPPTGTPVYAARAGRVVYSGWASGGYGFLVVVSHGKGVRTWYAHLSSIDVRRGVWVDGGVRVGLVGATGQATGPHLHFEVRVSGAAIDPLRALR